MSDTLKREDVFLLNTVAANDHASETAKALDKVVSLAAILAPGSLPLPETSSARKTLIIGGGNASNQKPNNTILAQAAFETPEQFTELLNNRPLGSPAEHFLCGEYADGKGREEGSEPEQMWGVALDFDVDKTVHHDGNGPLPSW